LKRANEMANDINYKSYPSYNPYAAYGPYASAVEEAAAKMNMVKRHETMMGMGAKEDNEMMSDVAE
jgi:hypothetical protein